MKCCRGGDESDSDDLIQRGPLADATLSTKSYEGKVVFDSDYSSGEKTDYSYTYQEQKDVTSVQETASRSSFIDPEMQNIPDYASMGSYRDISTTTSDYDLSGSPDESDEPFEFVKKMPIPSHKKEAVISEKQPSKTSFANMQKRLKDFLKLQLSKGSSSQAEEEEQLLPSEDESVLEATFSTPRADESTYLSHYSSSDSDYTESHSKTQAVPPLHLSSLDSGSSFSSGYRKMFQNIKYEVVRETSSSTSTTHDYRKGIRSNTDSSASSLRKRPNTSRYLPCLSRSGMKDKIDRKQWLTSSCEFQMAKVLIIVIHTDGKRESITKTQQTRSQLITLLLRKCLAIL